QLTASAVSAIRAAVAARRLGSRDTPSTPPASSRALPDDYRVHFVHSNGWNPACAADSLPGAVPPQRRLDLRIPLRHCDERHGLTVPRRVDVRSSCNEAIDDCAVVSAARPAMGRSKRRPTERRAQMNWIAAFDRDAPALEDRLYQLDLAQP